MPATPNSPRRDKTGKYTYTPDSTTTGRHLHYAIGTKRPAVDPTKFITGTAATTSWTWTDLTLDTDTAEKVTALENEVQELKDQLEEQGAELDAMREDVEALREENSEKDAEIESLKEELSTVENDRDDAIGRSAVLEEAISKIHSTAGELL